MNKALCFSAPGKLVLAGEYAVLEGCEALSTAVDRRTFVHSRTLQAHETLRPKKGVVSCVLKELETRNLSFPNLALTINSSALYLDSKTPPMKIGLGSSGSVAVAVTSAYLAKLKIGHQENRCFEIAYESHKRFTQGLGSGIDVATSFFGGTLRFQRSISAPKITRCKLKLGPQNLIVVHTGQKQSTSSFLGKIDIAKKKNATAYRDSILGIEKATQVIIDCLANEKSTLQWSRLGQAVLLHNQWMTQLATIADINIFDRAHNRVNEIAQNHGGFSKPSGAGGGDISLCFLESSKREEFIKELKCQGFEPLYINFCSTGVESSPEHM